MLVPGARVGPYEILSAIGAGGMGEVYRAKDTKLGRDVAMKVLPESVAADPERLARFHREAHVLASLNHPNIAAIYGFEDSSEIHALVMELVDGPTLADVIAQGPIALDEALGIANQVAEALDAAHEQGIVHRDLKPANIKVRADGTVKVLDFGLARAIEPTATAASPSATALATITTPAMMTSVGVVLGTAAYMAPEQARGKSVDKRADIWAFGCLLYEMLTGTRLFQGDDIADTLAHVLTKQPDLSQVPTRTRPLLHACLQKDPRQRLRDIGDARRLLVDIDVQPSGSRRRWMAPAFAAVLIAAAFASWWATVRLRTLPDDAGVLRLQIAAPDGGEFFFGNSLGGIALSPDGKTAAFVSTVKGHTAIWVRPLDGSDARMLAGTDDGYYPFWSADSKSIAFFTTGKLNSISLDGGEPLTVCDVNAGRGGAWTADGYIIFAALGAGLFRVPAAGGTPSPLTTVDASHGEMEHRWPQVLPGGRVMFWIRGDKPENTGVSAISLSHSQEHVHLLTTDTNAIFASAPNGKSYLLWQRDGTLVAQEFNPTSLTLAPDFHPIARPVATSAAFGHVVASASANGRLLYSTTNTVSQFGWFSRNGKQIDTVGEPGEYETFRLSPDGRRVAVARDKAGGADLWFLETERGIVSRLSSGAGNNLYATWSPAGDTIIYRAGLNLSRIAATGGSDGERLTESPNSQAATDWSPDGRFLLYYEVAPKTSSDLWALPVSPDGKRRGSPQVFLHTPFMERYARFSPGSNPQWVAYESDESGRQEVYADVFPRPGHKVRISTAGGRYPAWGSGGREIFYVSPDLKLMVAGVRITGDSLVTEAPTELFTLRALDNGFPPFDVSPDGQRILVRAEPEGQSSRPLTVLSNWPALLNAVR